VLSSDGLVKNLCLSIQDAAGSFSDNYFDLLPGDPVEVFFLTTGEAVDNFEQRLRITSLLDSFTADP
jgi:beta-mannosidase